MGAPLDWEALGGALAKATREHVAKELRARDARIATLEKQVAELLDVQKGNVATMNSLERRVSRHGDHLGHLETKVRKLERGTGA